MVGQASARLMARLSIRDWEGSNSQPQESPSAMSPHPHESEITESKGWASPLESRCFVRSLADGLPQEIAQRIHPDWRRNESGYWAVRDQLLSKYHNQWIAFARGAVIASGSSPVEILRQAQESGLHPFVICVGREYEPCRMRPCNFPYDKTKFWDSQPHAMIAPC
jgi:hypothetical protein